MAFKLPKRFKRFKIYLKRANLKIALGFRYAQTLLNLAFARFDGQFLSNIFVTFEKSKSNSEFATLMSFFCSLRSVQAQFSTCRLSFSSICNRKKRFFRESRREFLLFARRHSLYKYRLDAQIRIFSLITGFYDVGQLFYKKWLKTQMKAKQESPVQ